MIHSPKTAAPARLKVVAIPPLVQEAIAPNHWFLDFGKAAFGTLDLELTASKAGLVTLHLGEKLNAEGGVDREPLGSIRYRAIPAELVGGPQNIRLTIPPDTRNTGPAAILMPGDLFEVVPFRYVELEFDPTIRVHINAVHQLAVFYPFDDSASPFTCDDSRLNRVWKLCKYTIKATSFCGIYIDGDRERIPYEGDAYINQLCHYGVDSEYEMARASLEYLIYNPTWPTDWALHIVPMAWADYAYTGRTDLLAAHYPVLRNKALLELARADGLISTETGNVTPELIRRLHMRETPKTLRDLIDWPPGSFTDGGQGERDNYDMVPVWKEI